MSIRFVFFDLGNVLVRFSRQTLFEQVSQLLGRSVEWVAETLFSPQVVERAECGEVGERDYYEFVCDMLRENSFSQHDFSKIPARSELMWAVNHIFWPNDPMRGVVRDLAAKDFPRGILSNTGPWHWDYCVTTFSDLIQDIPFNHVLSYRVGVMKPSRRIYEIAFEYARRTVPGLAPGEVLFIDDLEENVQGAQDFGFKAFHYSPDAHEKLLAFLRQEAGGRRQE